MSQSRSTAKKLKSDVVRDAKSTLPHPELLGTGSASYYTLLVAYDYLLSEQGWATAEKGKDTESLDANEECGGSVEDLIWDQFPPLSNGIFGGLLHGLIQMGYGYAAGVPWFVWRHLSFI